MISLRGHHLLCSLTFSGRGYSKEFERGFKNIIERIKQNETIIVVSGPDEICEPIERCKDSHCREARITRRDELALEDVSSLLGKTIEIGSQITPSKLFNGKYRASFQLGSTRRACFDCQWSGTCDQIADADYSSSLLLR